MRESTFMQTYFSVFGQQYRNAEMDICFLSNGFFKDEKKDFRENKISAG